MSKLKRETLVLNQGQRDTEIELKVYIGGKRNTVTVVFRPVPKKGKGEDKYQVGVSRCGDNEQYSKNLGIDIATNRSLIQPYAILSTNNEDVLRGVAESIVSHMDSAKQPQLQNCIRLSKNKVKRKKTRQKQRKAVTN